MGPSLTLRPFAPGASRDCENTVDRKGRGGEGFRGSALTLRRFAEEAFLDCENTGDRKGPPGEGL